MNNVRKAIICMLLSSFFFALMSFFVKYAGDVPVFQKAFFRNAVAAMVALPIFLRNRLSFRLGRRRLLLLLCRVSFGAMGMLCNYYAIDHMNLADASMLNKTSPFFSMLVAMVILGERPGKRDWAALAAAFFGALLIMKPSFDMHFAYALIGILGGFGAGTAYAMVRKLSKEGVDGTVMVLAFSIFTCLITTPPSLIEGIHISFNEFIILLLIGISAAAAQFAVTGAYSFAETKTVSIYGYTQIIFAAVLSIIFFNDIPDALSVLGYLIIIGSSLFKQLPIHKPAAHANNA